MSKLIDTKLRETARPINWAHRPLGDIAAITMGNSPPGDSYNDDGGGVPLVNGPVEFSKGAFGLTRKIKFTTAPTKMCRAEDLLICVRGSTTGRTNIAAFDACVGRGVASIRAHMCQAYLNHFIRTLEKSIHASGKGSTFPSISQQQLAELSVPLPYPEDPHRSIVEQRRIADILDKADAIRRKRQEAVESLKAMRQAALYDTVLNSKKRADWREERLGEVADVKGGIALSTRRTDLDRKAPYLRVANVYRDQLSLSEIKEIGLTNDEFERTKLLAGDVLVVEGHGNHDEIGRSAIWDGSIPDCVHQNHLIRVRPKESQIKSVYLSAFINSTLGRRQLFRFGKTTSGLNTVSLSNVRDTLILLPPLALQ